MRLATAHLASGTARYEQHIRVGRHELVSDEPAALGGTDAGTSPYGLLLASLAACTAITLRMYADRKGWELGAVRVDLEMVRDGDVERITRTIELALDARRRAAGAARRDRRQDAGHQDAAPRRRDRRRRCARLIDELEQRVDAERLAQVAYPFRDRALRARHDDDPEFPEARMAPDHREDLPAVHVVHVEV